MLQQREIDPRSLGWNEYIIRGPHPSFENTLRAAFEDETQRLNRVTPTSEPASKRSRMELETRSSSSSSSSSGSSSSSSSFISPLGEESTRQFRGDLQEEMDLQAALRDSAMDS